jgi:predicted AlkP superfamily pyrophosphatase or phosphodiesterase
LLTISFSSNDYVGHQAGPDSPEVRDMALRTDQLLGKFFALLDQKVGMNNVLVVLSADHGVAAVPERAEKEKMPGGRLLADVEDAAQAALNRKFGPQAWLIPGAGDASLYFDRAVLAKSKIDERTIYQVASEAILAIPQLHVARVYSRDQLTAGVAGDFIARAEMNGFYPRRSGDLHLVFESGYVAGTSGTSHFSPYAYDRHVPVLFLGPGIATGRYNGTIAINDIAPTLATLLEIQTPSGSSGRVLTEMLTH